MAVDMKSGTSSVHEGPGGNAPGSNSNSRMDQRAMARLGRVQELKRNFGPLAMLGFASVLGVAWQGVLISSVFSLDNGGPAGAVIMFLITCAGLMCITISLAEMGSISPTAGGQYHWVSELANPSIQKQLSYMSGWITNLAWQVFIVASTSAAVQQVQGAVLMFHPSFSFKPWQTGLMVVAALCFETFFNVVLASRLPTIEFLLLVLHVMAWIAFEIVLLMMGPRGTAHDVFETFNNANDWPTVGAAVLIGIVAPISALTTSDSICHMAEELKDAPKWLPRTMVSAAAINFAFGFLTLITMLFRAGDINAAIKQNSIMPWIAIVQNTTQSNAGTLVLVIYIFLAITFSSSNMVTTASRTLYALARDGGVPFPQTLARVSPDGLPLNAIYTTLGFNIILACILMGSKQAFHIIIALGVIFLLCSYMLSVGVVTFRRLGGRPMPKAFFSLGKWGLPVNLFGLLFAAFGFVLLFFPSAPTTDLAEMNWSVVLFVGLLLIPTILYVVHQHKVYVPPVALLRDDADLDATELEPRYGKAV